MSETTSSSPREWRFYLDDMIGFADKVMAYTDGLDQDGFLSDGLTYDATPRNLELIGEAATHVPEAVRSANPHPWRLIVATRNRLIHGYLGIDGCAAMRASASRENLLLSQASISRTSSGSTTHCRQTDAPFLPDIIRELATAAVP